MAAYECHLCLLVIIVVEVAKIPWAISVNYDSRKCANCGSKQVAPFKQGYGLGKGVAGAVVAGPVGLLAGMFGSSKVLLHCLGCGNKWQAGKS